MLATGRRTGTICRYNEEAMPETTARIKRSFFEYRSSFDEPVLLAIAGVNGQPAIRELYRTLKPWGLTADGFSRHESPKLSEANLSFTLPKLRAVLRLGEVGATFSFEDPDWSMKDEMTTLIGAAERVLLRLEGFQIEGQAVTLGMHVEFLEETVSAVMGRAIQVNSSLMPDPNAMCGVSVYGQDSLVLLDRSVVLPHGLFIRIERRFILGGIALDQIAAELLRYQGQVAQALQVRFE